MSYISRSRLLISALTVMAASCLAVKPHATPTPTVLIACVVSDGTAPIEGVYCGAEGFSNITGADGYAVIGRVTIGIPHTITAAREGYYQYRGPYTVNADTNIPITLEAIPSPIPPAPDRSTALAINSHGMQGLICHTEQYGDLYWWDAAIPWLNDADRQRIYTCKGTDTHALIALPTGHPIYDECCNDYLPDRFPALDWSNAESGFDSRLAGLVVEARKAGFIPVLFPDERVDHSLKVTLLALDALQHSTYGDLRRQAIYMTGWDGVFYGWTKEQIEEWAKTVRDQCPDCVLGLEFNTGHIPQEAGIDMSGYDALLVEFERNVHTWNNWQIVPRLIGEQNYHRPSDDTSPHPVPRMPMMTARGEIQTVCFEITTYWHVRRQTTQQENDSNRAYLLAEGCPAID